jgi:hypothetical protein
VISPGLLPPRPGASSPHSFLTSHLLMVTDSFVKVGPLAFIWSATFILLPHQTEKILPRNFGASRPA